MFYNRIRKIALLAAAMLLLAACRTPAESSGPAVEFPVNTAVLLGGGAKAPAYFGPMEPVAQKGHLAMYADLSTGRFAVEDLRSGRIWTSTPENAQEDEIAQGVLRTALMSQMVITTVDLATKTVSTSTSYASCEAAGGLTVQKAKDGINVIYHFVDEGIKIPAAYRLLDDSLRVQINTENIVEGDTLKLLEISVLPALGAQMMGGEGYFILANGSGSRMNFNTKKTNTTPFRAKVFGDDPAYQADQNVYFKENYSLPMYGMQAGENGILAVCDLGAANATVNAASAGQESAFNSAYFSFELRGYQTISIGDKSTWNFQDVVTFEKTELRAGKAGVRYFFLDAARQGASGMAEVFRGYLTAEEDFVKREMPQTAPVYFSVLGAVKRPASFLGIEYDKSEKITDFARAAEMAGELSALGVSGIRMIYENWSRSLLEGRITAQADALGALGGKKELTALARRLKSMGGGLALEASLIRYGTGGNGFSKNGSCIKDINNTPVEVNAYKRNTLFPDPKKPAGRLLRLPYAADSLLRFTDSVRKLSVPVDLALSSMSNTVYTDFGKTGGRKQIGERIISEAVREQSGKISIIGDNPNYYVLTSLSAAVNLPMQDTAYDCLDESVPFYQMVLHGLIPYASRPLNTYGEPRDEFLRCIETGSVPHYELMGENSRYLGMLSGESYYGGTFEAVRETAAAQYARYRELYESTARDTITAHERLENGIVRTTYSSGAFTLVNYGAQAADAFGRTVGPKDFVLVRGGN